MLTMCMAEDLSSEPLDEIIWGAENIARELGLSKRQVYYMASRGDLPIGKVCGKLYVLKRCLFEHLQDRAMGGDQ